MAGQVEGSNQEKAVMRTSFADAAWYHKKAAARKSGRFDISDQTQPYSGN